MWAHVLKAGLIVTLGVLLGRILGFIREVAIASRLGNGTGADIAIFIVSLPDVFTNILIGGAVAAALTPELKDSPSSAAAILKKCTALSLLGFGALAGLLILFKEGLVRFLAPGFQGSGLVMTVQLSAVAVLSIPLTAATAVSATYLQSRNLFGITSLGTSLFNAVLIVAIVGWVQPLQVHPVAIAVVAAAALRWVSQWARILLLPAPGGPPSAWSLSQPVTRRYMEALASFGVVLLVPVAARAVASFQGSGAVATLNYAVKLVELPLGVAVSVLSIVLLPRFAELHRQGQDEEAGTLAQQGLWLTWIIAIPVSISMGWFGGSLVSLAFDRGFMTREALPRIAELTTLGLIGLPPQGLSSILLALLFSRKDTARPFKFGLAAFLVYVVILLVFRRSMSLPGVVLAGALLQWSLTLGYGAILARFHGLNLIRIAFARDLILAAVTAAAAFLPFAFFSTRLPPPSLGLLLSATSCIVMVLVCLAPRYNTLPLGLRTFLTQTRQAAPTK